MAGSDREKLCLIRQRPSSGIQPLDSFESIQAPSQSSGPMPIPSGRLRSRKSRNSPFFTIFAGSVILLCIQLYFTLEFNRSALSGLDFESVLFAFRTEAPSIPPDYVFNATSPFPFAESNESPVEYRFPRWNATTGISLPMLVDFMHGVVNGTASTVRWPTQRQRFPEIPYIFDKSGLWVSHGVRNRSWKKMWNYRVMPTEALFRMAQERIVLSSGDSATRWPHLHSAIIHGDGFPILVWYGDYLGCGKQNVRYGPNFQVQQDISIPLFTTCANIDCDYAFPLPTYKTILDSQPSSELWDDVFIKRSKAYPRKRRQVVWRGSLSHAITNGNYTSSLRWRLSRLSRLEEVKAGFFGTSVIDAGLVSIPDKHDKLNLDLSSIGGLKGFIRPSEDFQKYSGIIDVDGNSWSSRFGTILCYDSIVLKVEPQYVDLFMKDLVPGKHYIPIKHDLTDLVAKAKYVADPRNTEAVNRIKEQSHLYCREHMIRSRLAEDVLDVLEKYLVYLDIADIDWQSHWSQVRKYISSNESAYELGLVPDFTFPS